MHGSKTVWSGVWAGLVALALSIGVLGLGPLGLGASASAQDVNGASEAICCGASCCAIEGGCQSNGEMNPANSCEICNPSVSQTAWTNTCVDAGGGGGGGGGGGCAVEPGARGGWAGLMGAALAALGLFVARRKRR